LIGGTKSYTKHYQDCEKNSMVIGPMFVVHETLPNKNKLKK
jgi:hypothetical protein